MTDEPNPFSGLLVSEIREVIDETPMTPTDRKMLWLRFAQCATYDEIAEEVGLERRAVKRRIGKLCSKIEETKPKLVPIRAKESA